MFATRIWRLPPIHTGTVKCEPAEGQLRTVPTCCVELKAHGTAPRLTVCPATIVTEAVPHCHRLTAIRHRLNRPSTLGY
jgi:hypothetical protein